MHSHFPRLHDEVLSPESKATLKDIKQALVLCSRENNPSLIMTITKSRDDSCSSFLRAKLIRKEKRSAISSQFMKSSRIYQQKLYSSAIWRIHPGLLFHSSLTKFHPKEMLSFLVKKDKNKTSTYISQRFHQNTGPSLLNISREWQR